MLNTHGVSGQTGLPGKEDGMLAPPIIQQLVSRISTGMATGGETSHES